MTGKRSLLRRMIDALRFRRKYKSGKAKAEAVPANSFGSGGGGDGTLSPPPEKREVAAAVPPKETERDAVPERAPEVTGLDNGQLPPKRSILRLNSERIAGDDRASDLRSSSRKSVSFSGDVSFSDGRSEGEKYGSVGASPVPNNSVHQEVSEGRGSQGENTAVPEVKAAKQPSVSSNAGVSLPQGANVSLRVAGEVRGAVTRSHPLDNPKEVSSQKVGGLHESPSVQKAMQTLLDPGTAIHGGSENTAKVTQAQKEVNRAISAEALNKVRERGKSSGTLHR